MRWELERYVKLYRRDTAEWLAMPWQARGLFAEMLRKADREGQIAYGKLTPAEAVALLVHGDGKDVAPWLDMLLRDGCVTDVTSQRHLLIPNYAAAQGENETSAARTRRWREKQKAKKASTAKQSQACDVTCDTGDITGDTGDSSSQPIRASRSDPSQPSQPADPGNGATAAGRQNSDEEVETGATELLRITLQQKLGRHVGGCGRNPKTAEVLTRQIDTLGFERAVQASLEAATILERRGDPLRSLAALPGFLETVVTP